MARKIALFLGILVIIGAVAAGIAFYRLDGRYGLRTAKALLHDVLATPDTRVRISLDTVRLGRDITPYLPEELPVPGWLPWDIPTLLPKILPREIALLGASDFRDNAYHLTLFVNEQKGGPALPAYLNNDLQVLRQIPAVSWDEPGFVLRERGSLVATGTIPLPLGLEDTLLEKWSLDPPRETLTLLGGHVAEAVADNRNGEILTLIAALAPIWGTSLEQLTANSQFAAGIALLEQVYDIRLAVDFKNVDTVLVQFRIHAAQEVGGQLEFLIPLILGGMAQQVKAQYGLTLESEYAWQRDDETYVCDISVIGAEARLRTYIHSMFPAAPAATPASN